MVRQQSRGAANRLLAGTSSLLFKSGLFAKKQLFVPGRITSQFDDATIRPISGLDATFLYMESPTHHMHVGGVAVIQGSLKYADFRATIQRRIHLIPTLRKRLVFVPFSADYPYWVDDPEFDLDLHLQQFALPRPGSWKELRSMASRIFSEPLVKSRPLWSFSAVVLFIKYQQSTYEKPAC